MAEIKLYLDEDVSPAIGVVLISGCRVLNPEMYLLNRTS